MFKSTFMFIIFFLSVSSFFVTHPLNLSIMLMLLCLFISLIMLKLSISWVFYLLVLMFLGGVMILITYMVSIASNEKALAFNVSPLMIFFLLFFFLMNDEHSTLKQSSTSFFVSPLMEKEFGTLLIFCFCMLLFALISVVKLIKLESGPLSKRL
uniref:NADH dehydrogenase subunit 6 n=1 Tax=Phyllodiaptomus tunguidus TaxID=2690417 RepID=A0A6G6YBF8_9MAXI|nr:NADH dehydrogenase subunit 6 [Phyllodiaptomus tunguidus]QIG86763.1 NADH dehydrogenase subunit 6 [Phyllodiaptomus tunguidus]UDF84351.1 NADH dehydrogenase subunit 6 [Phyllodiaptomus tunguidus]UDF84403.1 NADH dehydrogenase subunit 6 [Phyllodiaptomus tunguidus]UDF84416.1 NADH dehydrogenase subunit 6 [Phyllodiaptomus tunguidus]